MTDISTGFSLNLPADGAASYLRGLTPVTQAIYKCLSAKYKRTAFTVTGLSDQRLIAKIRDELVLVMANGGIPKDFRTAVHRLTSEAGVEALNPVTLDTVFTTNMHKAYSNVRYGQMTDPAVMIALPFWQYAVMGADRVLPSHAVLDGFTALATDPVWKKIYPTKGCKCCCTVIPLLARDAPDGASEGGMTRLKSAKYKLALRVDLISAGPNSKEVSYGLSIARRWPRPD